MIPVIRPNTTFTATSPIRSPQPETAPLGHPTAQPTHPTSAKPVQFSGFAKIFVTVMGISNLLTAALFTANATVKNNQISVPDQQINQVQTQIEQSTDVLADIDLSQDNRSGVNAYFHFIEAGINAFHGESAISLDEMLDAMTPLERAATQQLLNDFRNEKNWETNWERQNLNFNIWVDLMERGGHVSSKEAQNLKTTAGQMFRDVALEHGVDTNINDAVGDFFLGVSYLALGGLFHHMDKTDNVNRPARPPKPPKPRKPEKSLD